VVSQVNANVVKKPAVSIVKAEMRKQGSGGLIQGLRKEG
jgi:hypothetical protein